MSSTLPSPDPRIGFNRHVTALVGANFVAATMFALLLAIEVAWTTRSPSLSLFIATITWLGVVVISAPASGLFFTLAFPLLRSAGERGLLFSVLLGSSGGYAAMWAPNAAAKHHASGAELGTATLIGAVLGGAYWFIAKGRPVESDPIGEEAEQPVSDTPGTPGPWQWSSS